MSLNLLHNILEGIMAILFIVSGEKFHSMLQLNRDREFYWLSIMGFPLGFTTLLRAIISYESNYLQMISTKQATHRLIYKF